MFNKNLNKIILLVLLILKCNLIKNIKKMSFKVAKLQYFLRMMTKKIKLLTIYIKLINL